MPEERIHMLLAHALLRKKTENMKPSTETSLINI
jgi:hypothetical protein